MYLLRPHVPIPSGSRGEPYFPVENIPALDRSIASLTRQIKHVLALDEVRGAGLHLRAKAANDTAQAILADLRKR